MQARWWSKQEDGHVQCGLCFRRCTIPPQGRGACGVRFNHQSSLISPYLGHFVSAAFDPIEKKPLYHWRPGSRIFSLGGLGCTMRCLFCQNHSIAQPTTLPKPTFFPIASIVEQCKQAGVESVAYTYNEPTLQAEYILAAAPILTEAGIATVLVTNGMFSDEVQNILAPHVSAANIDLKTFSSKNYERLGGSLETAKRSIVYFSQHGVHVEVTCLLVPGISDNQEDFVRMTAWLASVNPAIPLHLSRYFPRHKYNEPQTEVELMQRFTSIAKERLEHVYMGNIR